MALSPTPPPELSSTDSDMAEQALPGHGIPSQDPDPAAQTRLEPEEAARESDSVLTAGGVMVGAATGAAIGIAVAGPVGIVVGAGLGAVAGALGSAAASNRVEPKDVPLADAASNR